MPSFLADLQRFMGSTDDYNEVCNILDRQVSGLLGSAKLDDASSEWGQQRLALETYLEEKTEAGLQKAIRMFSKIVDTLDLYAPTLKGLQDIHSYTCEKLEGILFDSKASDQTAFAAAYLYGQAMAMSTLTDEAVSLAAENILLGNRRQAVNITLCILLGVERSSSSLFESNLPFLLRQVQVAAERDDGSSIAQEALLHAMQMYSPSERVISCRLILQTTHELLASSLKLCGNKPAPRSRNMDGLTWCCFLLEHTPMLLRMDLMNQYPQTCDGEEIFRILSLRFKFCNADQQAALCGALPVLVTWNTASFCEGAQVKEMVEFMCSVDGKKRPLAMRALGRVAAVVLDKFEPFLPQTGNLALDVLNRKSSDEEQKAAQYLLRKLLASMGPVTMGVMIGYLRCQPTILLRDVQLLEMTAVLLPNLSARITQVLSSIIEDVLSHSFGSESTERHQSVLEALTVFPLDNNNLAERAQRLVLWSLDEEKGKGVVMAALQVATSPYIATTKNIKQLTFKVAQLLLADDPHIVHMGLSVLSNPALASTLDEKSCSMILLALHQSLEPSIQIVAAKLLTHLTTVHRAIVQPLAWSHIRQSLSLMDFLHNVDPTRAIIEACIISNLLPALPKSLHKKYVGPIKELILSGLQRPSEAHTLSLIFQGLANLAKFEGWGSAQQSQLALDLLEMSQEIPKDSQHAALNAISRLLSIPQEGLDVYDILITVHATFGGRSAKLDADLKALVSGIYGHLGTVERNPVISRDSRAAINRETSIYTKKTIARSQVAEVRDKSGAQSQTHINWLVTKTLMSALTPAYRASEERSLVLEIMTTLGILQPHAIPALMPDLPDLILGEIRFGLKSSDTKRETTPVAASLLFLSATLHTSPIWLQQYWDDTAEIMAECIDAGESIAVLKGLDVILSALGD